MPIDAKYVFSSF